jgi:AcrR family transcriptional regulator
MTRKEQTRTKLLEVAFELFSTIGFEKTTTRQIAELAGVNELTLFRHFETKHNLFQTAIKVFTYNHDIESKLQNGLVGDFKMDIQLVADLYLKFLEQNEGIYKIQLKQADDGTTKFTNSIAYKDIACQIMVKNYPELHKKHNLRLTIVEVCAFVNGVFNYNVLSKPMIDEFGIKTLIDNYINNVVTLYTMC